jgi:hypothetical protein
MTDFFAAARQRYLASNAETLRWMLARPPLHGVFVNTKLNPLTLVDYAAVDGWRSPDHVYGWIQGRALEALVTHAAAFEGIDAELSLALDVAGRRLYAALDQLRAADGHVYFCYDRDMRPIRFEGEVFVPQTQPADIYSFSDTFAAKGLVAGAARYAPADLPRQLEALVKVIAAIEDDRFQIDEKQPLSPEVLEGEAADFGPRMIMLSAGALLTGIGHRDRTAFADRFIAYVVDNYFDPASGLLRNVPGEDRCNVGHGIEFVGFALAYLEADADPALLRVLETILVSSFDKGFVGPGVRLVVSAASGAPISPYCPWWSLPETIRSAALCHERSHSAESLSVWQMADEVFFRDYWRPGTGIAYQCLTDEGPVDYVPATPDLDPGYHTGLSLLAAIDVVGRRG